MSADPNPKPKSEIQSPKSKQNPEHEIIQNPNSKIQNPKPKIQTAPFRAATKRRKTKLIQNQKSKIRNPKSKIQNPKSKIQIPNSKNPNSKLQTARLEFGFWIWGGAGGDGHVANEDVWPPRPPDAEFGLVQAPQAGNRKVAGSIPPMCGPNWAPISGRDLLETELRFPAPCRGIRGSVPRETAHKVRSTPAAPTMCVSAPHSIMHFCCVGKI